MSSIGLSEWVLLALIGLIVLGPERLPRIANQIGGWIGQARRMTRVMKRQLEEELDLEKANDIKPPDVFARTETPAAKPVDSDPAPPHVSANEDDDTFSPAHAVEDIGTGVDDDEDSESESEETATTDAETVADNNDAADEEKAHKS
jgi:sec-independent protein translocase protein TatB